MSTFDLLTAIAAERSALPPRPTLSLVLRDPALPPEPEPEQPPTPVLTVKNLKSITGTPEGDAWSCTLACDGQRVATVCYDGWGGGYRYTWIGDAGRMAERRLRQWVTTLPEEEHESHGVAYRIRPDLDTIVARVADDYETAKRLRRACRTKILYALPGDDVEEDGWRTVKGGQLSTGTLDERLGAFGRWFAAQHPDVALASVRICNREVM